jgi:hypothetical protein
VNQRSDAGDDENHHRGKRIETQSKVDVEVARANPAERLLDDRAGRRRQSDQVPHSDERHQQRREHHAGGNRTRSPPGDTPAEAGIRQEAEKREEWDEQ